MRHQSNTEIHRAALRATAKIALSLTVVGCAAHVEVSGASEQRGEGGGRDIRATSSATGSATNSATNSATSSATGGAPTESLVCDAAAPGEEVTADAVAFDCCVNQLQAEPAANFDAPSAGLLACCNEVIQQIDANPALLADITASLVAPVWPEPNGPSCCNVLGNPCSAPCGCTVWGPPVPRALARRLHTLAELEAA